MTHEEVTTLLREEYGIDGSLSSLPGENRNFLVTTPAGRRYVIKISDSDTPAEHLLLEGAAARHLAESGIDLATPVFVPTRSGEPLATGTGGDGDTYHARLLEYVDGVSWCELPGRTPGLLEDLGRRLAMLAAAFASFSHPAAERTHQWDLTDAGRHRQLIPLIESREQRRTAEWLFHLWAAAARPRLDQCPVSFIHNDANDENVLVDRGRVVGLLDFGDSLVNPAVCELAIALAYVMMHEDDPLAAGARVVSGYHAVRRLERVELAVLFPLICGRLATTVTIAARRRREDPHRESWFATEGRAWVLINRLTGISPREAGSILARSTGVEIFGGTGASLSTLLSERQSCISASLSVAYDEPIKIVRGCGRYLHDCDERPYLDLVNNVCHVGHCHPRVVEAGQRQLERLNTNTRYVYDGLTDYASRLCDTLPDQLSVCFIVNSGSEANELALRLARAHTGRRDMIVVDGAYHGNTGTLIALSPYKFMSPGGAGRPEPWVHVSPLPDGYRGKFRGAGREVGEAYGNEVGRVIENSGGRIAGFLVESLISCAGQVIPPEGYLETAFHHVREAGGVCIADEVQVGFGRVGTHFWGFELQNVIPDIVVLGKPIGNGYPLGAVVTTPHIAASFANGMEYFNTYGGNPVACAIGLAVLDVIEGEGLQEHARRIGQRLLDGLIDLKGKHDLIGDVRGSGLFIGAELVRDRNTLEPADREATELVNRMRDRGILLSTDGIHRNVLKIKPPMVLDEQDVDMSVRSLGDVLAEISA
ncbi:MAG: aminotransferase class III-fold pyridoxal phosphate-dependent enzyme [Phycisphaerales bacterium]|nr:MAG: aminotransferase class III-fold pyridoxal phosphate-dependent enzyme [Phycisphaerales bacterium]